MKTERTVWATALAIGLLAICFCSRAAIVVLNQDQPGDYTFASGNTYYITNVVNIYGTATFEGGAVIKYGTNSPQLWVENINCQTVATNPAIFTARDDDDFGETLSSSTHSPSGFYGNPALQLFSTNDAVLHDLQFYYADPAVGLFNATEDSGDLNYSIWNIVIKDCGLGFDCNWAPQFLNITNLTMTDCSGAIASDYMIGGSIMDSTFVNVAGGLVFDEDGYGFYPFRFGWCNFSNSSLSTADVDVFGDHNGFANCAGGYFGDDWYWLTNTTIRFSLITTNNYVSTTNVTLNVNLISGTAFYDAVLVDGTNTPSWTDFNGSNVVVNLGTNSGWHDVWVGLGLRGSISDPNQAWVGKHMRLDLNPPLIVITNPVTTNLTQPIIQLAGYSPRELQNVTYDLSNAVQVVTNEFAQKTTAYFDQSIEKFTTNNFIAPDIHLAEGLNIITLHATDKAGNMATTNFHFTLDLSSRTNDPIINVGWPHDGDNVSGTQFTITGTLDDPATSIFASFTTNGVTQAFDGRVGRDGKFYIDASLPGGTNIFTLTARDVMGQTTTTNLAIGKSALNLTMFTVSPGDTIIQGSINLTGYTVTVNGVTASIADGVWTAEVPPVHMGDFMEVEATPNGGGQ